MMREILNMLAALSCCILFGNAAPLDAVASRELQRIAPEIEDQFMPMIVVVDTSGPEATKLLQSWREFEANWPNRNFCILQVRGGASGELLVPQPMKFSKNVLIEIVNRDMNLRFRQSDWFNLCNLQQLGSNTRRLQLDQVTTAAFMLDVKIQDVLSSYIFFMQRITSAGISLEKVTPPDDKDYVRAMNRHFLSSNVPSFFPSANPTISSLPSFCPSDTPTKSSQPSISSEPSAQPSLSAAPSLSSKPSLFPSSQPSLTAQPSKIPTSTPSDFPSLQPSSGPSGWPTETPTSSVPSSQPSSSPSTFPSDDPSGTPTTVAQLFTSLAFSFHVETEVAVKNEAFEGVMKAVSADIQKVVIGDLPSARTDKASTKHGRCQLPEIVDDIFVCYGIGNLVGYGSDTHGQAVAVARIGLVRSYENGNVTPITGEIIVDWGSMWATDLYQIGLTAFTSLLGVGTLWDEVVSTADGCQYPADTIAAKMFKDTSSCDKVPMEDGCGNFRRECFITTHWPGFDGVPINPLVVASLEDLGYEVDYKALDGQTTLNPSCLCQKRRQATDPSQRRLSTNGKKKDAGNRLRRSALAGAKLKKQEGRQLTTFDVIDLSGKVVAVLYRDNGTYFTEIRKNY